MEKDDIVRFNEMQIGDYFTDTNRQKYRKIRPIELTLPDQSPVTLNAFHFQSNAHVAISPESEWIFIKHTDLHNNEIIDFELLIEELELDHRIEFFSRYLEILESFLTFKAENASSEYYNDDVWRKQEIDEFISMLHSSFFVSLYSFLETQLNNECRSSQQANPKINVSLYDIQGSGITRAKTYLTKILDTSFHFENNSSWEQIQWYKKIRNCIVHNNSIVTDSALKLYIDNHNNLGCVKFFGDDYVVLGEDFCRNAISVIGWFLRDLLFHRRADKII